VVEVGFRTNLTVSFAFGQGRQWGHEDQFRPPSLNGGCRLAKATFAGTHGNEQEAPIPVIRGTVMKAGRRPLAVRVSDAGTRKWSGVLQPHRNHLTDRAPVPGVTLPRGNRFRRL
jgi:hypothetical protein